MDSDNTTIPQPAKATYPTAQDAIDALFAHGKEHGYCVRLKRSKPDGKDVSKTRYYYVCDRYGEHTSRGSGVRSTGSIATNCRFQAIIYQIEGVRWELDVKHPFHNHGPSPHASAHQGHRKRAMENSLFARSGRSPLFRMLTSASTIDTIEQIRDLTRVGMNPKHIHAAILERDPQTIISQRDVYNQRSYHRGEHSQPIPSRAPAAPAATPSRGRSRGRLQGSRTGGLGRGNALEVVSNGDPPRNEGGAASARGIRKRGRPSLAVSSKLSVQELY
jgi:hypothetical protein